MSLFEKIEPEPIELEEEVHSLQPSTRQWSDEPLVVQYGALKKVMLLIIPLMALPICEAFLEEGVFLQLVVIAGVVIGVWYLADCLLTRNVTFFPDRIVRYGYLGKSVLPAGRLVMTADEQKIRFYHGTEKNVRESIRINRFMVANDEAADILKYAKDFYGISGRNGNGRTAKGRSRAGSRAIAAFEEAASTYASMAIFLIAAAVIAVFTAAVSENFAGFDPGIPELPLLLAGIVLAVLAFLLLRALAPAPVQEGEGPAVPVEARLDKAKSSSLISALVAVGVALLGLGLFFLYGNILDFYLFLLVGILYFGDFYPRLSAWEGELKPQKQEEGAPPAVLAPRRSLQVSLVLMGALAVASQGESRHYLYANRQDCLNDWGDGKDCQEPPRGSSHYGTRYYYGPRYGSGGGRITRSVGVGTISRGGFGSMGSFHASFGG